MNDAIVVFARHPTPGRVKTRLAAGVGDQAAAQFYRACAERVIERCTKVSGAVCRVCFSSPEEAEHVETWLAHLTSPKLSLTPQLQSQDLGARLHHALTQAFAAGHRRAVVVGTDVPDLNQTILERALKALDDHDAVFGPAEDGGYYLMGIRATPEAGLFEGMQWSTSEVLQQSVAAAERCGLSVAQLGTLPTLPDIDTAQDLEIWCKSAGSQTPGDPLVTLARRLLTSALHEPPKEQEPP